MSIADFFSSMDYGPAPESDAHARAWLARHDGAFGHFVDGEFSAPLAGAWFDTIEPATGNVLARVAQGSAADVDAAVRAARAAQPAWWALGGHGRARHLYALSRMVQRHSRLFAVLESLDNGKPLRESRDLDIPLVARHFLHHAGWAQLQETEFPGWSPHGVAGQIVPWNFPLLMLAWKVAPAIALGNCVVLKPAEQTPLTALLFAELAAHAGLPPGVLNVVTGDGDTGAALVDHPDIDKIAFTGSTDVGRRIRARTAGSGKALTLELGGKSPFVVFDTADLDAAVEGVVDAIWFNQGQVCCAGSRLLVQEGIVDDFHARLKRRMRSLRMGSPLDKSVDMGAIISPAQRERIASMVDAGREQGAQVWQDEQCEVPAGGTYYPPTLVTGALPGSDLMREEIFGPVLVSATFRTPDEAVELANNTRYGLAASVWTENISLALDVAPRLAAGVVWINATNMFDAAVGFGGYRESGFGREGGREGAYEYLRWDAWYSGVSRGVSDDGSSGGSRSENIVSHAMPPVTSDAIGLDRTAKLYIGGKQVRPDGGYSLPVRGADGHLLGEVAEGNRKDIRNAVAAARKAQPAWRAANAHARAQILYFLAENLSVRAEEFAARLVALTGASEDAAREQVRQAIARLFTYAAWADKFDGAVHAPPLRGVVLAMNEPLGVIGVACPDEQPLLALVSLMAPILAMGNSAVLVCGPATGLIASDFYQVVEASDVPAGVVNIVTGDVDPLICQLASHDDVDAVWCFGSTDTARLVEELSAGNLKRTFTSEGRGVDWSCREEVEGPLLLCKVTQVKNIWVPYGD